VYVTTKSKKGYKWAKHINDLSHNVFLAMEFSLKLFEFVNQQYIKVTFMWMFFSHVDEQFNYILNVTNNRFLLYHKMKFIAWQLIFRFGTRSSIYLEFIVIMDEILCAFDIVLLDVSAKKTSATTMGHLDRYKVWFTNANFVIFAKLLGQDCWIPMHWALSSSSYEQTKKRLHYN